MAARVGATLMMGAPVPNAAMPVAGGSTLALALLAREKERKSGVYDVTAGDAHTRLYVSNGSVVFADAGTLADALGRVLVREGKLTTEQYTAAIEHMTRRLSDSTLMRFGEVVVTLGFLRPEDIDQALSTQVRDKAMHTLMQEDATWTFTEAAEPLKIGHFPCSIGPLVLGAAKQFEPDRIERVLALSQGSYPRLVQDPDSIAKTLELSAAEQRIVGLIDGAASSQALAHARHADIRHADALLAALLVCRFAELIPHPTAVRSSVTPATSLELLDAAPDSTPFLDELDDEPPTVEGDSLAGVSTLRFGVKEPTPRFPAPSPGTRPIARPTPLESAVATPVDPRAARLMAEGAFQKGKLHLRTQAFGLALPELRRAAALCPESVELTLYAAWATFTAAGTSPEAAAASRTKLAALAEKSVKQEPSLAFGFFVLGQMAMLEDAASRKAMKLLRHALKLDPDLLEAKRYLRLAKIRAAQPAITPRLQAPAKERGADGPSVLGLILSTLSQAGGEGEAGTSGAAPLHLEAAAPPPPSRRREGAVSDAPLAPVLEPAPVTLQNPNETRPVGPPPEEFPLSAPLPAPEPPLVEPPVAEVAPVRRSGGRLGLFMGVLGWVVAATTGTMLVTQRHAPPVSTAAPQAAPIPTPTPTAIPTPTPTPTPTPAPTATQGTVLLPASARGHRVFVDGRVATQSSAPLRLPCGSHTVKIGSSGHEQSVDVPCGGEVHVE